ncbi:unnamed protein product [Eruca vesicaria subsp. sativa]|uniref:Uncharacterized protein n=1 Tax=Eruca vesicaria subsp. sativa TaxID=29727 RepID=A0ABC8KS94_ERUVS|nr:unnamed protein product [Eruca vesicaria subsp. sativa]
MTWAVNTLTLLPFKERDAIRRDALLLIVSLVLFISVSRIVLSSLFLKLTYVESWQIDDWRDIALPKDLTRGTRVRSLGVRIEYECMMLLPLFKKALIYEERAEKQLCAIAASNVYP